MKPEDHGNLTLNTKIWYKGEERKIMELWALSTGTKQVTLDNTLKCWDDICLDCSLEPPKEKRKVYQHFYITKGQEDLVCISYSFCPTVFWEKIQSARTLLKTIELFECE